MKVIATSAILIVIVTTPAFSQNLLVNGDFEDRAISGGMLFVNPGMTDITGWIVGGPNNVDLIRDAWVSQSGSQSIDLNGWGESSLGQWVPLTAGQQYVLSFWVAGNTETRWYSTPSVKSMDVFVGSLLLADNVQFDTQGKSSTTMGWDFRRFEFTANATGNTFVQFVSGNGSPMGIALDNVVVAPLSAAVPEPGEWAAMGILGAGLAGLVIRKRRAA